MAQPPRQLHAGEIAAGLKRLGVTGSVLYVAAHPDDENTRLLAWLVGERGLRAGYLSVTRGDGGQNLIGTEQDALLGLIRTHELLAARRVDGAEQFFTRARDFGYSKSAEEALRIWGHEEVLADVVLAIRRFQPDVIITRFTTEPPNHGHHTASALLAAEAFIAAADPKRFPEQLSEVKPWKADRLLQNASQWWFKPDEDLSRYVKLEVGGYDALLGRSWGEVAAESRSQHKSQGFGQAVDRGPSTEYFTPLAGTLPKRDVFEGLDFSWRRWKGSEAVSRAVAAATKAFDARAPTAPFPRSSVSTRR
ncbi:PIG-L family deacetylase [Myxococcus sp. MxC21-1]|uniref:PIG-L family deacetylase n=1 Tax=Myxococcus sp. MxC21-1 TaxID=3041439 RepID=UPI002930B410|nr:PIG-L family deacetylase [Myxococcus sp. MxC21-1]WNZ61025.1 PIG-L family deacetylase [Myxococcus sp. MxC21-1]